MSNAALALEEFPGQQENERILYTIESHPLRHVVGIGRIFIVMSALAYAFYRLIEKDPTRFAPYVERGYGGLAAVTFLWLVWHFRSYVKARAYLTDRRIVRFEALFPVFEKRRSLLWKEVTKSKSYSPLLFRIFKVGNLEVIPLAATEELIKVPYAYYFEDLASYIDKIIFITKSSPEELKDIRDFVPKPKGQRY